MAGYYDRRDLIGHFIRRRQRTQQMCTHPCCRGKRVHPDNMPVILPNKLLRRASDDDLAAHFRKVAHSDETDDVAAKWQILAEFERRCCPSFRTSVVASLMVGVCATGMAPPGFRAGPLVFMVSAGCSVW